MFNNIKNWKEIERIEPYYYKSSDGECLYKEGRKTTVLKRGKLLWYTEMKKPRRDTIPKSTVMLLLDLQTTKTPDGEFFVLEGVFLYDAKWGLFGKKYDNLSTHYFIPAFYYEIVNELGEQTLNDIMRAAEVHFKKSSVDINTS